jgi:hypothetical protein
MTFGFQGAATMPLLVQMVILAALSGPATLAQPQSASILRAQYPTVAMLPSMHELPDPLLMLNGRRVTSREQWIKERRTELIGLFEHYMYGALPPRPNTVTSKLEREDRAALGGKATLQEVTVTFGPPELPPIHLMLVLPNRRPGPAPVVLSLNYFGNHTLLRDHAINLSTNWIPAASNVSILSA